MAQDSKIEWTDHTCNLWIGCDHVHAGCDHCYAEALANRWGNKLWGGDQPRKAVKSVWSDFARYQKLAAAAGEVHRVFVGSMMDIAEKPMPLIDSKGEPFRVEGIAVTTAYLRAIFYSNIVPNCPNLDFLLLTKRPSNFNKQIPHEWLTNPPANVMFGTSIVQRDQLDTLLKQLKRVNGRRFLSLEPQLENIPNINLKGIDWVIQGGESGPKKRPFNTDWGRSMKYQCQRQNVPYFFKQVDKIQAIPDDLQIRQFPAQPLTV